MVLNKCYGSWNNEENEDGEESDIFDSIETNLENLDIENNIALDKRTHLASLLSSLLGSLRDKNIGSKDTTVSQIVSAYFYIDNLTDNRLLYLVKIFL